MLLDRRRVKFWQKIVFGFMAFLMAAFLVVGYSGVLNGCTGSAARSRDATETARRGDRQVPGRRSRPTPRTPTAWRSLGRDLRRCGANQQAAGLRTRRQADLARRGASLREGRQAARQAEGRPRAKAAAPRRARAAGRASTCSLQDYQAATGSTARSPTLRPKDASTFFDMATVAINAGDTNTALLAFTRFLELDPHSPDAPQVKDWIEQNSPSPRQRPRHRRPSKGAGQ